MFNRRKRNREELAKQFGKPKNEYFNFKLIRSYFNRKNHTHSSESGNSNHTISEQTCLDLDFDLFFEHVDHTYSKVGQQYLYNQLRNPNHGAINEEIIDHLSNHPLDRLKIMEALNALNSDKAHYLSDLFQGELAQKPKWYFIVPLLSLTSLACIVLSFFMPAYLTLLIILFPVLAGFHYFNKVKVNVYVYSVPQLLALNKIAKKFSKMPFLSSVFQNQEKSIRVLDQIKRKVSIFKLEQKIESDLEIIYWFLLELIKITFLLEPLLLFSILDNLRDKKEEIDQVFQAVGKVDMHLSIASLRAGSPIWCKPQTDSNMSFNSMIHPLVENCVPNSFSANQSFLLTGSNMSGKTTFIRAIGLNYIAGTALNTCFAENASFPEMKLHSVIRITDDVSSSSSYFFQEVNSVKSILSETDSEQQHLILLDELFKGTNTTERIASAKAILSYFHQKNCLVFVSTHDYELVSLLKGEYAPYYFNESIHNESIEFDYQLKKGVPSKGNAIKILELNEFPEEIISEAKFIVSKTEQR